MISYPLRSLFWEATLRCNAYCEFCGSRCGDQSVEELTTGEICSAFSQIAEKYDPAQIMVNVTGGEPLLRQDLFQVLDHVRSLGFHWGMVTNGVLLTEDVVQKLKHSGCSTLSISIDGTAPVHDRVRRLSNGFERICQGIRRLREADFLECLMITTVVTKRTIGELPKLRQILKTLPVDAWRVCPVDPIGRADVDREQLLDTQDIHDLVEFLAQSEKMELPYVITTSCSHFFGMHSFTLRDKPFSCATGKQVGSILANGDIYVCPNVPRIPELIQGNVRKDSFPDVWERGFQWFRDDGHRMGPECRECPAWADCRGDSMHTWDMTAGKPKFCAKSLDLLNVKTYPALSLEELLDRYRDEAGKLRGVYCEGDPYQPNQVVVAPDAASALFRDMNRETEQIGCLLGHIFQDTTEPGRHLLYHVAAVRELEPVYTSAQLLLADVTILSQAREACKETGEDWQIIGFIHTHPGQLDTAMSAGDHDWHCELSALGMEPLNLIFNPQKRQISAYTGLRGALTEVHLLGI